MYMLFMENGQYGISGNTVRIPNITCSRESALGLVEQMNRLELSECHVLDVVEDWLAQ